MTVALGEQFTTVNGVGNHTWATATAVGNVGAFSRFTIAAGPVLILALWGIIKTTPMDGTAATLALQHSLGPVAICGDLAAIASDPAGTLYIVNGVSASLLQKSEAATAGFTAITVGAMTPIGMVPGDIDVVVAVGNQVGTVEWHCVWQALDPLSTLVVGAYV